MKSSVLTLLSVAALTNATPRPEMKALATRQFPVIGGGLAGGEITAKLGMGGRVAPIAGQVPETKIMQAQVNGATRVKIRYGPYQVPSMKSGIVGKMVEGGGGMMWNVPDDNVKKPCTNCMITFIQAGLEDSKGNVLNTNNGLWMHHMVALNIAKGRRDATCAAYGMSLPHIDVGARPGASERFFSSGNERTPFDFSASGVKAGYHVRQGDKFSFIVDLMNMNMVDKKVYMTLTYEFVKGTPSNYKAIRPVWFDIFQCGLSDVGAKNDKAYTIDSIPWRANFDGQILLIGGHLHDGGTHLEVQMNGKTVCDTVAKYGTSPQYISGKEFGGQPKNLSQMKHLGVMSRCVGPNLPNLKQGQSWKVRAHYDYGVHPGMLKDNGKPSDVMGISIMWVAVPQGKDLA